MDDGGLVSLLDADARADIERMYRLFRLVPPGLDALNKVLRMYVTNRGKTINETTRPVRMAHQVLRLRCRG